MLRGSRQSWTWDWTWASAWTSSVSGPEPQPGPDCYHGHYVTLFALLCQGLTYNLTKCLKCFASTAACRLPPPPCTKFAVESFLRYEIGNKFLILVAVAAAADPKCGNKILCASLPPLQIAGNNLEKNGNVAYYIISAQQRRKLHFTSLISSLVLFQQNQTISSPNKHMKLKIETYTHTAHTHSLHTHMQFA